MKKLLGIVFLLSVFIGISESASQPQGLGKASLTTASFPATSQVTVSTMVSINPTGTYMVIESTGLQVLMPNIGGVTGVPAIATATAFNGQYLILDSTTSNSTVKIETGTLTAVIGSSPFYVISSTLPALPLIYNNTSKTWKALR